MVPECFQSDHRSDAKMPPKVIPVLMLHLAEMLQMLHMVEMLQILHMVEML